MRHIFAIAAAAILVGCSSDVVTSNYATLADARADELFGRGWLLDVLPQSARDIRATNDLDLNVSDGEFSFDPADSAQLFKQLHKGGPNALDPDRVSTIEAYSRRGYSVWHLEADRTTWVFFCQASEGHCVYTMWFDRQASHTAFMLNPIQSRA